MAELGLGLSHTGHTFEAPNRRRCTLELGGNEDGGDGGGGGGGSGALKGAWKNTSRMETGGEGGDCDKDHELTTSVDRFFFFFIFCLRS